MAAMRNYSKLRAGLVVAAAAAFGLIYLALPRNEGTYTYMVDGPSRAAGAPVESRVMAAPGLAPAGLDRTRDTVRVIVVPRPKARTRAS